MKRNIFQTPPLPAPEAQPDRKEAYGIAVRKYGAFILDYFHRKVSDAHTVHDLGQEFWLHVWRHFDVKDFDNPVMLRHKAYQIFVGHTRQRDSRAFVEYTDAVPEVDGANLYAEPQSPEEEEKFIRAFWELFPGVQLSDEQKRAFYLKHKGKYTFEEISALMNVPLSTVHVWVTSVINKCRRHFDRELL